MAGENPSRPGTEIFSSLYERTKELNCLYCIEEILSNFSPPLDEVFRQVIAAVPAGWQYAEHCQARIVYGSDTYESPDYAASSQALSAEIRVQDHPVGQLFVSYSQPKPEADKGPFLKGETKLIQTIAERLGQFILHQRLQSVLEEKRQRPAEAAEPIKHWRIALDLLRNTDQSLFLRISRKMMNYLSWRGVSEARSLLMRHGESQVREGMFGEANWPQEKESIDRLIEFSEETFRIASANLTDDEIFCRIQRWTKEDRSSAAVEALEDVYATLTEVFNSMRHYKLLQSESRQLPRAKADSVRVTLIRRFFTEQLEYINILKKYVDLEDFFDIMGRIIFAPDSHGKLGGKSAGLFLAGLVLDQAARRHKDIGSVKRPKTWYISSDGILSFIKYNNLEEMTEQKYKDIEEVRQEYPQLVQVFKNCVFPPEIVKGLSVALDDFGEVPLIVRSSSLLEDRLGTAFAGKYKSLFLANTGDKKQRLEALLDAVAEVYASIYSPDPIQYRAERGLLDFHEEMGIMIQAVVGRRVGRYYFPTFAGVAFSRNEFRWSPRIRREDGLLRLVPGLGTRAVDRLSDDYPILVSPGQPNLRVNVSLDEIVRYTPKKIDVIDLENNCFRTMNIKELLREVGADYPSLHNLISVFRDEHLQPPQGLLTDFAKEDIIFSFNGLISGTPFIRQLKAILDSLESALGIPVDVEFAYDGTDFYLLQCRPQSQSAEESAVDIPAGLPQESILFTAKKFISNGRVADISHIVYVEPDRYGELATLAELAAVGQAVGKLNKVLPRRKFILMGPGRWGSRGDIKLGVRVTYSDINNAAMLIEVARKKGNYVPDVSFGTHFFQDLVESNIRYLALYPDDPGVFFNDAFLQSAPNQLAEVLPGYKHLADALRLIDVPQAKQGKTLQVVMNAQSEQGIAFFAEPGWMARAMPESVRSGFKERTDRVNWRRRMAERIAAYCPAVRWGVKAMYLVEDPACRVDEESSDISLLVLFQGSGQQRKELEIWLEGWNAALTEMHRLRTGMPTDGILNCRFLDGQIREKSAVAASLSLSDSALLELPLETRSAS